MALLSLVSKIHSTLHSARWTAPMTQMTTLSNARGTAHDLNEANIESLEAGERGKHLREAQFSAN
jgi:hypothetical protein